MARSGDRNKARDTEPSKIHNWDESPPYSVGDATDTVVAELPDPEPAASGDVAPPDVDNDETLVASSVELAMQSLQHHQVRPEPDSEENPPWCFGSGDATFYVIEDGIKRLMIGRAVGRDGEGCIYCLVGTSSPSLLALLDAGELGPAEAFDDAAELTLCSVFQSDHAPRGHFRLSALNRQVSNVVLLQHYKRIDDVPVEYRPGQPFLQFTDE